MVYFDAPFNKSIALQVMFHSTVLTIILGSVYGGCRETEDGNDSIRNGAVKELFYLVMLLHVVYRHVT